MEVALPTLPPKGKVKAYKVLGDVSEFQERLAATLPPPKAPSPPDVFSADPGEFPPDVWFAATISPDNGVAVIAAYKELCKARALYQQQLNTIHTARKQNGVGAGPTLLAAGEPPMNRTIAETLKLGAETRRLGKFDMQQQKWDEVTVTLAARVGRQPQELAMQRGPAWRTRAELTELLYRAQPRDARGLNHDEVFVGSLRDAWERVIPVGSIFSGLFLHLREKPHDLPACRAARVGRPLDPLGPGGTALLALMQQQGQGQQPQGMQQGTAAAAAAGVTGALGRPAAPRSLSARGRSWEDGEVLRQRVAEYGSALRTLAPHDPEFGSLAVAGSALEGQLAELAGAPISLAEVEAAVREANPEAYAAYRAVKDEMEAQLRAALEAEEAARAAAAAAAAASAPQPGPHAALSVPSLSLSCHCGETAAATVSLRATGTAAVNWRWRRRPGRQHAHAATELSQPPRFVCSQQSGVLLPGQSLELTVTFVAHGSAGTFREDWELVTQPPLQGPAPSLTLHLRGAAELRDASGPARAALEASLAGREKMAVVAAALERILRDVRAPRRPAPAEAPTEAAAGEAWDRANGCSVEGGRYAWPPLFHSAPVQGELSEVYREAQAAQAATHAAAAPAAEEDAKKKKKESTATSRKKTVDDSAPAPKYPPSWEATGPSLAALDALLSELAAAAPAAAAPLAARAEAAKAAARVPANGRKLLRRAMRVLVGRMADAVEERFNTIRTDLEAKAAAEAAAAGGGGGTESGESVDPATAAAAAAAEASSSSVATSVGGSGGKHGSTSPHPKTPNKAGKGAKGGKGKGAGAAAGGGGEGELEGEGAAAPGSGLPSVAHLQPAFHDKAMTGARSVIKSTLNGLGEEVLRHKVAVGDALEDAIRAIDARIAAEQERLATHGSVAAGAGAGGGGGEQEGWFSPPGAAGGVPAVGPGPAAAVRSTALESLYWERLGLLRQWTALGVPNRQTIR